MIINKEEYEAKSKNIVYNAEGVLEEMTNEEFLIFAKKGYQYSLSMPPSKHLRKNMKFLFGEEIYKIEGSPAETIKSFTDLPDDDLRFMLLSMMANVGLQLSFNVMEKNGSLERVKEDGEKMTKTELNKEVRKERRLIDNTALIIRDVINSKGTNLDKVKVDE